jgi:beta-galactosidase
MLALALIALGLLCLPAAGAFADAAFTGTEWTGNSTTFAVGSENARAHYYTYSSLQGALDGYTMYPESGGNSFYMTLSDPDKAAGAWRFSYAINPGRRLWPTEIANYPNVQVSQFAELGFDDSGWDRIAVPGNWEINWLPGTTTKMYDKIIYRNSAYAWGNNEGTVDGVNTSNGTVTNPAAPANYNAVGTYRRNFAVPANWSGRTVTLNLDGADTFYVWVNGTAIGYSEDTMAHREFDITDAVNFGADNAITVQVIRWSTGSWLEDQDMLRLSGIFRDIYLLARNDGADLYDFEIATAPTVAGDYSGEWDLSLTALLRDWAPTATEGRDSATVYASLYDSEGKPVAGEISSSSGDFSTITTDPASTDYTGWQIGQGYRNLSFDGARRTLGFTGLSVKPWTAETPNLYKLVLRVGDVYTCIRVGFRQISFQSSSSNPYVAINGQRLLLHGTNMHETNPYTGRAMTEEMIRNDLRIMKENNFNHIRMSHYIHNTMYYDVADEYGIYVMDEANLETHGNRNITSSGSSATWGQAIRDRQVNMYERDKNYPCVFSWSLGNESAGSGVVVYGKDWIKARDTARPIHCEFENQGNNSRNDIGDVKSNMYTTASGWDTTSSNNRPNYLCEYSHGEGNSNGNYLEYINVFETNRRAIGGAIWDWVDQSVWTPLPGRGDEFPEVGYMAVGGDWGDSPNDGFFIGDGALFADRTAKESMQELKYLNSMLRGTYESNTASSVTYAIRNKNLFVNADAFDMAWEVTENGKTIRGGSGSHSVAPAPDPSAPLKYTLASFTTSFEEIDPQPGAEYIFSVIYTLKSDTLWADAGLEIAREQFPLDFADAPGKEVLPVSGDALAVEGTGGNVTVTGEDFSVSFANGVISSYEHKGKDILSKGPTPNFYRGVTDNERAGSAESAMWSWANPSFAYSGITVERAEAGNLVVVTVPGTWSTKSLTATTTYTIYPDGEIKVNERYQFSANPASANEVPEVGAIMTVVPGLDKLTWYGRGPSDAYVDRRVGVPVGIYSNTVAENYVMYQRAQEMGTKNDTRWFTLTDGEGFGLMVKSGEFAANSLFSGASSAAGTSAYNAASLVEFNALHYEPWELSRSSATGGSTSRRPYQVFSLHANDSSQPTILRVNAGGTGVGGDNTWGARPLGQYRINISGDAAKSVEYNFSLKPIDGDGGEAGKIEDAGQFWSSEHDFYQNLIDLMGEAAALGITDEAPEYAAAAAITASSGDIATLDAYNTLNTFVGYVSDAAIVSFGIDGYAGVIDHAERTILVTLPYGYGPVTALTPVIACGGEASIESPSGAQNFTAPVVYHVVNGDELENYYTVTVVIDPGDACDIRSFALGTYAGAISGTDISVIVPVTFELDGVAPAVAVSLGAACAPGGAVSFAPGEPMEFVVTSANGTKTKTYSVTVSLKATLTGLVVPSPVLATNDLDGADALPAKLAANAADGLGVVQADVAWNPATVYTPYETLQVTGEVTYMNSDPIPVTATVEVVKSGTVYWINSGTGAGSGGTNGSVLFTAVKGFLGEQLINEVGDQASTDEAVWGTKQGSGSNTAARNRNPVNRSGQNAASSKWSSGIFGDSSASGANTANNNYEYRIVGLKPNTTYEIAIGATDFWSVTRTQTVTVVNTTGVATGTPLYTSGQYTVNSTLNTRQGTFTTGDGQTSVIIRLTANGSGDPTCCWISISDTTIVPPTSIASLDEPSNFAVYEQDATKAGIAAKLPASLTATLGSGAEIGGAVAWNTDSLPAQAKTWQTLSVSGLFTAENGKTKPVAVSIEVVPRGLVYFVDAGSMIVPSGNGAGRKDAGSRAFDSVAALVGTGTGANELINAVADQQKTESNAWGYTTAIGDSAGQMTASINENGSWYIVPNYTDKINYGWFGRSTNSAALASINYTLAFDAPGDYVVSVGVKDWWPPSGKTQDRQHTISIAGANGAIAAKDYRLFSEAGEGPEAVETLAFTIPSAGTYTFSVANRVGDGTDDPVLAWFAIQKAGVVAYAADAVKGASSISTDLLIQNFGAAGQNVTAIVAVYDASGKLAGIASETKATALAKDDEWQAALTVSGLSFEPGAEYTAKAFIWDSGTLVPLCGALDIDLS